MPKKAQGLSMNTIIIAALALLVLSIVSLLFIGRMNVTRDDISACENNGGVCVDKEYGNCQVAVNEDTYSRYSVGRELSSYTCLDNNGEPRPNHICCAFS